jgi:membrane-associated phospholipid phosphatase
MTTRARFASIGLAAATLVAHGGARAQEPPAAPSVEPRVADAPTAPTLTWDPEWSRVTWGDYAVTGAAAAITLGAAIVPPSSKHAYGGVLFDQSVRDALRLESVRARYTARDTSDVLLSLETTYPFFIDALVVAWGVRKSPDVAYQMMVIDAEAFAIASAVQGVTNTLASRERPYGVDCGGAIPGALNDCSNPSRYRSFFSGHSTLTFTGASLICSHHVHLALQGEPVDTAACITGYAVAATTATLRVMGDMHYASDVIIGAVVGTAIGLGIPAIHYARHSSGEGRPSGLDLRIVPSAGGLAILGEMP